MSSRLKGRYQSEIVEALKKKLEYKTSWKFRSWTRSVMNMGVGEAKRECQSFKTAIKDMEIITGQKAVVTRAKKSVANSKMKRVLSNRIQSYSAWRQNV